MEPRRGRHPVTRPVASDMSQTPQNPIPDELLSAYIDGAVTAEERRRIEQAMAADPWVAWRVETLRETVRLLRELPPVPLPRSFTLREEQVADVLLRYRAQVQVMAAGPERIAPRAAAEIGFWQRLRAFFQAGNPMLRNAAAATAALFVLLILVNAVWSPVGSGMMSAPQAAIPTGAGEEAAPAVAESAPLVPAQDLPGEATPGPMAFNAPAAPASDETKRSLATPRSGAVRGGPEKGAPALEPASLTEEPLVGAASLSVPAEQSDEAAPFEGAPQAFGAQVAPEAMTQANEDAPLPTTSAEIATATPAPLAAASEAESTAPQAEPATGQPAASAETSTQETPALAGRLLTPWTIAQAVTLVLAVVFAGLWLRSCRTR